MRKILTAGFCILIAVSIVVAEPILTEDAKCIEKGNIEIGLGVSYGVDAWTLKDQTNSADYKVSLMTVGLPVKYGANDKLQLSLNIPYLSWKSEVDPDPIKLSDDDSGLGQITVAGKLSLSDNCAAQLDIRTPTGDVEKSLGEKTDVGLFLIASKKLEPVEISGNIGYLMKTEYKNDGIKYDPADPIILRASVEYPINELSVIGEARTQVFGKKKIDGTSVDDSNGSTLDFLVGGQYLKDAIKLKLGFEFAAGNEDYRAGGPLFRFYDSWDWKIILAGSYKFEI